MNIYDISDMTGVSIATVSRVLNNSPKVSESTRRKVMDAIRLTGYSRQKHHSSQSIGIIYSDSVQYNGFNMISTLVNILNSRGITPYLWVSDGSQNDLKPAVDFMRSKHVYAIVCDNTYLPSSAADTLLNFKNDSLPPVIMINSYKDTPGFINVICDIKDTFSALVSNALKSGAASPAFLFSSMSEFCLEMLDGFKLACAGAGIEPPAEYMHLCSGGIADSYKYIKLLNEQDKTPDAIFCSNDMLALGASNAIALPDVRITGCGCNLCTEPGIMPFDSINCRFDEITRHIADTLFNISINVPVSTRTGFTPYL
ncbi:MAG: LacI family DNA-binding transcriptional regulator [Lachnospiraceae bacterium]|nr:LacI family DNA-binding transcriptional regulator [Lachnospiraceae bacterium]